VTDYLVNPRRSPRLPARCRVTVAHGGAGWVAETEDLGPRGCQLLSSRPLDLGGAARLIIESSGVRVPSPLSVLGHVAWRASAGRHRAGVAFADRQPGVDPASWFKRLLLLHPELAAEMQRVPERVAAGDLLYLRPPPMHLFDLGREEVRVLRALKDRTRVADLIEEAGIPEGEAARAVFALLERRVVTLAPGEGVPAWRWKAALAELEAQGHGSRNLERVPGPGAARPWIPPPIETLLPSRPVRTAPVLAARAYAADLSSNLRPWEPPSAPRPEGAPGRPPEAQECFDRAVSAISAGEMAGAEALLRRALALSPRDPEVAVLLGRIERREGR